jgi:hypothetical protein
MTAQHEHTSVLENSTRMKGAIIKANARAGNHARSYFDIAAPAPKWSSGDLVELVSFAINAIGPAKYRAAIFGKLVTVFTPDEATAEVLRAALLKSSVDCPTNRLIQVEVDKKVA